MNILICGDSFAADYSVIGTLDYPGWPQILGMKHNVTNVAQAGCSEYKIYLQLKQSDLDRFDGVIVFHTSPYRIYVKQHPYLSDTKLHCNSDLIYYDIINQPEFKDKEILSTFFEKYFDLDYAKFVHVLIQQEITKLLHKVFSFHIGLALPHLDFDASDLFERHRGQVNHFDPIGNKQLADILEQWIQKHDLH